MTVCKKIKIKICAKYDASDYHKYEKIEGRVYELYMYDVDKLSLGESHKELCNCEFRSKLKNNHDMKSFNDMNCIHDIEVNNIAEFNLLLIILNTSKHTKIINNQY